MATTTDSGVATTETNTGPLGMDDAADAFLARLYPDGVEEDASKRKPSEDEEGKTTTTEHDSDETEEAPESTESEEAPEDEGTTEDAEAEEPSKSYVDNDEAIVKVKVGEEEIETSVKDLKRLYGQEAALTRKSQEVAELRRTVEQEQQKHAAGLDVMVKLAEKRAEPYKNLNFFALSKDPNISADELKALHDEAQHAIQEERFLKAELGNFVQAAQQQQTETLAKTARETVKTLADPSSPMHVPGWNQKVYDDLRSFAIEQGIGAEVVNNIVDAPVIKLLHMAMSFAKGAKQVQSTKTTAQAKTPKKIVKTSNSPAAIARPTGKAAKVDKSMKALQRTGSLDDAGEAFLARLANDDE